MNIFRKSSRPVKSTSFSSAPEVFVSVPVESDSAEVVMTRSIPVDDLAKSLSLPDSTEYSLKNLIASGVPLREVPVTGLLSDVDPASAANVFAAAESTEAIQKEMSNSNDD